MGKDLIKEFDEDEAISFIRKTLPDGVSEKYTDDEILYIIDIIWEWYERNGYTTLDFSISEEETLDLDIISEYVRKEIGKDGEIIMDPKDIDLIVRGEIQYEESLDVF